MRRKRPSRQSKKDMHEVLASCDVDGETFRRIVEGGNSCLTLQELREVADILRHFNGQALDNRASELSKRFREHVERDRCPDCSEFYEAIVVTLEGAAKAINRFTKSA